MPPKSKFTRDEVSAAAFEIVRKEGIKALSARRLASELGSSPRPVFTVFESMDELQAEVVFSAKKLYSEYIREGLKHIPAFKGVGEAYIKFASEQPKLFHLLFMSERSNIPDKDSVLALIDENYEPILKSIEDGYGLDRNTSKRIYIHLWIYSHGIATLIATDMCSFTADEVSDMLKDVFVGILKKIIAEEKNDNC